MGERPIMDERDVELIDYLRVMWRQKWVIAVTLIAAIAAAWGASLALTPTYRTETSLLLLPPLSSQLGAEAVGSRLTSDAYGELAVSTSLLEIVREKAGLQSVDIEKMKRQISVSAKPFSSEGEFLLRASIKGADAEQLVVTARAWTEAFSEAYGELFQDRVARSYSYVSENYAETEAELGRLAAERTTLLVEHPISILEVEVGALQSEVTVNQSRLAAAHLDFDTTTALVTALEQELAAQPRLYNLKRSISPDSLVAALGGGLSAREIQTLMEVQVESEHQNDTYVSLNTLVSTRRADVRQLEEEILRREERSTALRPELAAKQRELTETQAAQDDLTRRIDLLQAALIGLAANLLDARLALAETPEPIRVIDEPLAPRYPIAPKKAANIAIAGFLGLLVGTLLAFFVDYLARVRERGNASRPTQESDSETSRHRRAYEESQAARAENVEDSPS